MRLGGDCIAAELADAFAGSPRSVPPTRTVVTEGSTPGTRGPPRVLGARSSGHKRGVLKTLTLILPGAAAALAAVGAALLSPWWWAVAAPSLLLALVASYDLLQRRHSVLRNYPLLGHLRFALEALRPEIQQYFIERNIDGSPFDRDTRSIVYERAKGTDAEEAFGTERDLLRPGSEYLTPSMAPHPVQADPPRVRVGGPDCTEPYDMSLLNVSAMSFGSLSANAVLALNTGAQLGGFAHDTGEGGVSEYHRRPGGDLIWEIGTGYFGCRTGDGGSTSGSSPKRPRTHRSNACR